MNNESNVGRVVWSDISKFIIACGKDAVDNLSVGSLVRTNRGDITLVSLVINIMWVTDDLAQNLARTDRTFSADIIEDQIWRRIGGPVVTCIVAGYKKDDKYFQMLPNRPAIGLAEISVMQEDEVQDFVMESNAYLQNILTSIDSHKPDIIANHLQYIADCLGETRYRNWILGAKRTITKTLSQDPSNALRFIQIMSQH